jgi:leader peptidase (prepilin peptidase)/N-methyltransferase
LLVTLTITQEKNMLGYLLTLLFCLLIGLLVNWLADWLPAQRARNADESEDAIPVPSFTSRLVSVRYIVVEIVVAVIGLYLWHREGPTLMLGVLAFYLAVFVLIAIIDIEHKLVLNSVMFPAFAVALIETLLGARIRFTVALSGYAFGQVAVMAVYVLGAVYLWIVNTQRDEPVKEIPFGFGDVTLATYCGLVVGFPQVIHMLVLMILLGGAMALLFVLVRLVILRNYKAHTAIPYGPSIVLAASLMLLWGDHIANYILGGR